jgi:hypothetical protein
MDNLQVISGSLAGFIFAGASWNMVVKAWRTKDLRSYSLGQILLNNIGNVFYWFYVVSLPIGPIYYMHGFFTLVSIVMLIWYLRYAQAKRPAPAAKLTPAAHKPASPSWTRWMTATAGSPARGGGF